jgi:uncharacterized protein YdhG (YjbR/CyaY superfamily)
MDSIDDYIASQPEAVQAILVRVRAAIRKAVPRAEESISYNIPTYKLGGRPLIYFAAWKKHYSIYPASASLAKEFKEELAPYEIEKGTIRFPYSEPAPVKLIARIAKFRAREISG